MRCYRLLLSIAVFGVASLTFSMWSTHKVVDEFEAAVEMTKTSPPSPMAERLAEREHIVHHWALAQYLLSGTSILVLFVLILRAILVVEAELKARRPHPAPKAELHKAA